MSTPIWWTTEIVLYTRCIVCTVPFNRIKNFVYGSRATVALLYQLLLFRYVYVGLQWVSGQACRSPVGLRSGMSVANNDNIFVNSYILRKIRRDMKMKQNKYAQIIKICLAVSSTHRSQEIQDGDCTDILEIETKQHRCILPHRVAEYCWNIE